MTSTHPLLSRTLLACALMLPASLYAQTLEGGESMQCPVGAAVEEGRRDAVEASNRRVDATRDQVHGTPDDEYSTAEEGREEARSCMIDAASAIGDGIRSDSLGGLLKQITGMITDPESSCNKAMEDLRKQAEARAKQQAAANAQRAAQEAAEEKANSQSNTAGAPSNASNMPPPTTTTASSDTSSNSNSDPWGALSQQLNNM